MEALERPHVAPRLDVLERVIEFGLRERRSRVFADVWDIERFFSCACSPRRAARLRTMNERQAIVPSVECSCDAIV
jgi:hypothetical protein